MRVSAVVPTRGDVPVEVDRITEAIRACEAVEDIHVVVASGGLWGRYQGVDRCRHDVVFTCDDDCMVDAGAVIAAYQGGAVTCNMPIQKRAEYPDGIALVGWGAVYHRSALAAFDRYRRFFPEDELFHREADRVFTGLNRLNLIDVPFSHLPRAFGSDRMGAQANHLARLSQIRSRIRTIRNG